MGDLSLKAKADILCEQLNIDRGTPLVNVLAQACEQLAVRSDPNMSLVDKADACLSELGIGPAGAAPPQAAGGITVVQGRPVETSAPVHYPAVPVAAMPAVPAAVQPHVPAPPRTTNRLKLALRDGRGLALEHSSVDATHPTVVDGRRAFHIRMGTAHEAIEVEFRANGNVGVVSGHHTLGYCLDNWYGRTDEGNQQHVSTWYRTHGTHDALRFTFNNDDGTVSPLNARHMVLGWGAHSLLVRRGDHRQMQFAVPPGTNVVSAGDATVGDADGGHAGGGHAAAAGGASAHDLGGCWLAWGTCCLVIPVLGAMICNTPKSADHYHSCGFLGLCPATSTHWKRAHGNVWYAYEGGPNDAPGNQVGCGVQREVKPDGTMCETSAMCFNGCLCKVC